MKTKRVGLEVSPLSSAFFFVLLANLFPPSDQTALVSQNVQEGLQPVPLIQTQKWKWTEELNMLSRTNTPTNR